MTKICHLTIVEQKHLPRIKKEGKSAYAAGYDVYVVSGGDTFVEFGIHYYGVPFHYVSRLKMYRYAKEIVAKGLEIDAEIYQLHDPIFLLFAFSLKKKGKKIIFDSHEFYGLQIKEKQYIPKMFRNSIAWGYMFVEAYICKRIDAVLQVCTVEGINYFSNRCRKFVFISNVPELSVFVPDNNVTFNGRDSIIHVGGLTHNRGITHLIEALNCLSVKLKLAGNYESESYLCKLMQLEGFKNVEYLGYVPNDKLPDIFKKCFAGVATLLNIGQYSRIDTLPTKCYEYMSMGLPVILSNTPYNVALNEQLGFAVCVDPANPAEIQNAVIFLQKNPILAKQMGERGQSAVRMHFHWGVEEVKLLDLYRELTS